MKSPKAHAQNPRLGSTLLLHYTCRDEDGTILETTEGGEPDCVRLGDGDFLPALELRDHGSAAAARRAESACRDPCAERLP